jgi:hypothetical protein
MVSHSPSIPSVCMHLYLTTLHPRLGLPQRTMHTGGLSGDSDTSIQYFSLLPGGKVIRGPGKGKLAIVGSTTGHIPGQAAWALNWSHTCLNSALSKVILSHLS